MWVLGCECGCWGVNAGAGVVNAGAGGCVNDGAGGWPSVDAGAVHHHPAGCGVTGLLRRNGCSMPKPCRHVAQACWICYSRSSPYNGVKSKNKKST